MIHSFEVTIPLLQLGVLLSQPVAERNLFEVSGNKLEFMLKKVWTLDSVLWRRYTFRIAG
jgi:hypothetical protein